MTIINRLGGTVILIKDVFVNGKRQDILIEGNKIKKIGEVKKKN